jgi:hypothetical protein
MQSNDTVQIPLRDRQGRVRAYTVVDAADAEWVNQWRWFLDDDGYAARRPWVDGKQVWVLLHREMLGLEPDDGQEGDHIDRDRLNNRRVNLRAIPKAGNRQNRGSLRGSSSDHRGVGWDQSRQRWMAYTWKDGRMLNLGRFKDESDAAGLALTARLEYMPYATD